MWQIVSMNASSLLKLTRKIFVHTTPCSQFSKQIKPTALGLRINRTTCDFMRQGIWRQDPTLIPGGRTMLSPAPHPLLLPIWRQHSLAHHVVVPQIAKALSSSSPCSSNFTTAQETTGTSSSTKPSLQAGAQKSPALFLTGRSPGGPDWLVRSEWQEHCPQGYSVLKDTVQ